MGNRPPLSQAEKERIYWGKQAGRALPRLAAEVGCSFECARKWWRVGRDKGLEGLRAPRRGRGSTGILSHFDPRVAERALDHKRQHPRWGANRVLVQLKNDPELTGLQLPRRSRLCVFFKEHCPECVAPRKPRVARPPRPPDATGVHEVWQLDSQEGIRLHNGEIATVCNIRDPVGAAMIAKRNHRTLDNFALDDEALGDTEHLQQAFDRERCVHNHQFPSQASDCAGRPPVVAHPELLTPRRYYQPELELALFDLQRVYSITSQHLRYARESCSYRECPREVRSTETQ